MGNDANDVSIVYASDTVDFGTIPMAKPSRIDRHETTSENSGEDGTATAVPDGESYGGSTQSESDSEILGHAQSNPTPRPIATDHHYHHHYRSHPPQHAGSLWYHCGNGSNPESNGSDPNKIDNRGLEYIPVRLACGPTAYCSPDVLRHCPMVLRSVQADLAGILRILPASVHSLVRRTNLWLNWNGYAYGPPAHPTVLRHITTHHHPAWLVEVANDAPRKAGGIEIYSCLDYARMRLHWNGSGLLLHEFCHLVHQCCLEDGLDNRTVEDLYEAASDSGRYEAVLRRDWAGKVAAVEAAKPPGVGHAVPSQPPETTPRDFDLAYAMVDKKEFFAEMSVAFWAKGYRALDKGDPGAMEACSPPLLHPEVTDRVRVLAAEERSRKRERTGADERETAAVVLFYHSIEHEYKLLEADDDGEDLDTEEDPPKRHLRCCRVHDDCCWTPFPPFVHRLARTIGEAIERGAAALAIGHRNHHDENDDSRLRRMIDPVFREDALRHNCSTISHCNKFYPFTRGQLFQHDPLLAEAMGALWGEVRAWEDPWASTRTRRRVQRQQSCAGWCP